VLSLGAKPRGLKPGNNILILFQKDMCILCFILSVGKGGRTRVMRAGGTHAVPWVTSVNPDACE
jgi:hypothetical protein